MERRASVGPTLLPVKNCCIARNLLHQLREFNSSLCVTIDLTVSTLPGIAKSLSEPIWLLCEQDIKELFPWLGKQLECIGLCEFLSLNSVTEIVGVFVSLVIPDGMF